MTTAASPRLQRGTLELRGSVWWLRRRMERVDPASGEITLQCPRVKLGSFRSRSAARIAADKWLARQSTEALIAGPTILAVSYFERFLKHQVALWRPTSQRQYRSIVRCHLVPGFAGERLSAIDAPAIREFIAALVAKGLRRSTIHSIRAALLRILREARGDGYQVVSIDPRTVPMPKELIASAEPRFITDDELPKILEAAPWPFRAVFALMAFAGLRISEALGIRWSDVDFEQRTIRIRQSAVLGRLQLPKTKTSRADVPLLPALAEMLRAYHAEWTQNAQDLLFASRTGSPLRADNVRVRTLQPLLKRLGLTRAGFHSFRHSLPRRLLDGGAPIDAVRRYMRHADLKMTARYIHNSALDLGAVIDAAAQRISAIRKQTS